MSLGKFEIKIYMLGRRYVLVVIIICEVSDNHHLNSFTCFMRQPYQLYYLIFAKFAYHSSILNYECFITLKNYSHHR